MSQRLTQTIWIIASNPSCSLYAVQEVLLLILRGTVMESQGLGLNRSEIGCTSGMVEKLYHNSGPPLVT